MEIYIPGVDDDDADDLLYGVIRDLGSPGLRTIHEAVADRNLAGRLPGGVNFRLGRLLAGRRITCTGGVYGVVT